MNNPKEFVFIPPSEFELRPGLPDNFKPNFTGQPCPKKEVVDLIEVEGVESIDKMIKEMIRWRVLMFGRDSSRIAFPARINFFDKNNPETCITCSPLINFREWGKDFEKNKKKYYYPERADTRLRGYNMEITSYIDSLQDKISKIIAGLM